MTTSFPSDRAVLSLDNTHKTHQELQTEMLTKCTVQTVLYLTYQYIQKN